MANRVTKPGLGFSESIRLPEKHAEGERRVSERGLQCSGAAQGGLRAIEVVTLLERDAQVVERLGVCWVVGGDAFEGLDGGGKIALVPQRRGEIQAPGDERRMRGGQL